MDLLQGFRFAAYTTKYHPTLIPTLIRTRFQTSPENFFLFKEPVSAEINMLEAC